MDPRLARWLVSPEGADALILAATEPDPGSLAAAERLRRVLPPDRAAAVLTQVSLRRRAVSKLGPQADTMFLTGDGLEQATRPLVAAWRAERLRAAGVVRVLDLGCGIGADALAFAAAGLQVVAVEQDEATAVVAGANLGRDVIVGDATELLDALIGDQTDDDTAVFCDPARRTSSGRSWRVEDLTPPWSFVQRVLALGISCVKLGPGVPHALIPPEVAATWVSAAGDLVELSLWSGPWEPGRAAVLLPQQKVLGDSGPQGAEPARRPHVGEMLYEPDPAVIRAGLIDRLAAELGARRVDRGIAYLIAPERRATPFATGFEILDVLDADEKSLRAWVRVGRIGTLEIKKRGLDVDPAVLRRRLKPSGPNSATLVLSPTPDGARALVVRRLDRPIPAELSLAR